MKKIGISFCFLWCVLPLTAMEDNQKTDATKKEATEMQVAVQMPPEVTATTSAASQHFSSRACAQRLFAQAGYEADDVSGLHAALKHYKQLAGNLDEKSRNGKRTHAQDIVRQAATLAQSPQPNERALMTKAQSTETAVTSAITPIANEVAQEARQFIQQLLNERVGTLNASNTQNGRLAKGFGTSTAVLGMTSVAFLVTWLMNKKCSCSSQ